MTPEERIKDGIDSLPGSLEEAIKELSGSEFARGVLGNHIFEKYIEAKNQECSAYKTRISKWEIDSYLMKY